MKKFLLLLLFCFSFLSYQAQNYTPFPEKFGKWIIFRQGPFDTGFLQLQFILYETVGDTLIKGFTYKKVAASNPYKGIPPDPANIWSINFGPKQLAFAYRNDIPDKTVYILTDTSEVINGNLKQEYKWYDFKIKVGDTLKTTYSIKNDNSRKDGRSVVRLVDSTLICGGYEERFYFKCSGGFEDRLVEGVGFIDNFIRTNPYCDFEPMFTYATYFSCSPTVIENKIKQDPLFSIFPNPASNNVIISFENDLRARLKIINSSGQLVYTLNAFKNNTEINVSFLSPGLYLIQAETDENVSIQKLIKE